MWAFFGASMVGIAVAIFGLIRKFAAKTVESGIIVATVYAWLTAMMIIALVPIDVSATKAGITSGAIGVLWDVAYWSTQAATWLVLPFIQVYADAGDFTVKKRCWTSIKENGILYGAVGVLALVGVALLLFTQNLTMESLMGLGIFMSNAFGLIAGILLMGYGLVEIPRSMWKTSYPETQLKWCVHRAGKYAEEVMRATAELETVVTIVYANQKQMRRHDCLKPYMDIVAEYAERESPVKPSSMASRNIDIEVLKAEDLEYNFDVDGLAALRRRLCYAIDEYRGTRARYVDVMVEAFELEDIVKCRQIGDYAPRPPLMLENGAESGDSLGVASFSAEPNPLTMPHHPWTPYLWKYQCLVRPVANKVFAVTLALVSFGIIWSEATIAVESPNLSPFSLVVIHAQSEFTVQLMVLLPLAYICACCYYALFKINAFNYNKLIPRATTGSALMQNGSLMCRFAAPTCWNFYHIIHFTQAHGYSTVFGDKMASMDVTLPGVNLNFYLPIVLLLQCSLVALNLWDRALNACASSKYKFSSDDVDDEYTSKGRMLVRKEQESALMGYPIGDVLHSAYFDLEFPTVASHSVNQGKGGFFSFLKRGKSNNSGRSESRERPSSSYYSPLADQVAAKWGRSGGGGSGTTPRSGGASVSRQPAPEADNPRTSLLAAKFDYAPHSSDAAPGGSGLDGIFAGLSGSHAGHTSSNNGSPAPSGGGASAAAAANSSGPGAMSPGTRANPNSSPASGGSLLSRWGFS